MTGIVHEPQYNTFLENDVYHYGPIDDRARWVVEQLHELYDEGLLDQEFATIQHAQWEERVTAGQAFSMIEGFGRIDWANGLGRELNPDYTMWGPRGRCKARSEWNRKSSEAILARACLPTNRGGASIPRYPMRRNKPL